MLHKLFLRSLILAALLFAAQAGQTVQAAEGVPAVPDNDVRVVHSGETFTVDVTVHTPAAPALAWAVLTDFDHMAGFLPNLTSSQIMERSDTLLKVAQKGVARFGFFSKSFESIREIELNPSVEIRANNVGGNLKRMQSVMQLQPEGTGTRLTYHADVVPGFWFPPMIGPSLVRHETAEQISAMLKEMLRRQ
ncbi:MAG: SRPBCC family protein [Polaromonas sp.]